MAMFIDYKNGFSQQWHVGEDLHLQGDIELIAGVQADGDELDVLYSQYQGLPIARGPVVRWFGDMAKFIVANLRLPQFKE